MSFWIATVLFLKHQIFIGGREHLNRAVHQDVVAIELLPRNQWSAPSSLVLEDEKTDDSEVTQEGEDEDQLMTSAAGLKQPTGRVVGIIKRNWRQYCGMLQKSVLKGVSRDYGRLADVCVTSRDCVL